MEFAAIVTAINQQLFVEPASEMVLRIMVNLNPRKARNQRGIVHNFAHRSSFHCFENTATKMPILLLGRGGLSDIGVEIEAVVVRRIGQKHLLPIAVVDAIEALPQKGLCVRVCAYRMREIRSEHQPIEGQMLAHFDCSRVANDPEPKMIQDVFGGLPVEFSIEGAAEDFVVVVDDEEAPGQPARVYFREVEFQIRESIEDARTNQLTHRVHGWLTRNALD